MKKTIFREMFFFNMLTVLLSILVTAVLLYTQLGSYLKTSTFETLNIKADNVSSAASFVFETFPAGMSSGVLQRIIEMDNITANVAILDKNANVLAMTGFDENSDLTKVDKTQMMRVLSGESVSSEGYLGGALSEKSLYVMTPVVLHGNVAAVALLSSAGPYLTNMRVEVMGLFFSAVVIAAILSFLVSALLSQRIARPIREMTVVAKKIASGDFSQRVSTNSGGELKVLSASFNHMSAAIKEMDDMQSAFISDVSHELRTPMTIISGFVEGVLDGTIPESEQKKYLEIVLSEIKRLNRLVNDLLEMSRLKSGKIEYKMVPFDINESIRKAVISFDKKLSDKEIDVEVNFQYDTMYVLGSQDSIYRVITNLMDNAVKFTPQKGRISISSTAENGKTKVAIENSGEGLSERELIHIWDRFYQTDKSRSSKNRGAGLGLYIVKNIMAAHSNDIYAESEAGKYTRFIFELDSVKGKIAESRQKEEKTPGKAEEKSDISI